MKIVMVHTMYAPNLFGGAERLVQILSEGLVRAGHQVSVVAASPGRRKTRELAGVHVHDVGLANLYWPYGPEGPRAMLEPAWHLIDLRNPVMASRVSRVIDSEAPDLVHTHGLVGFSTLVWRDARLAGRPVVHTMHDHRLHCLRAGMFKRGRACDGHCLSCRLTIPVKRAHEGAVDLAVAVSRSVLDEHLAAGFFSRAMHAVIGPPVEPCPPAPRQERHGPLRAGYLGRLHPGKGVELLLSASMDLPAGDWTIEIAGDGERPYVEELHGRPRHPNVSFVGRRDQCAFLGGLDILVVPSQWLEPAGLVVVEALAQGVPVLASRRGGLVELVDEDTGALFDPSTPHDLASLLRSAIEDPGQWRARGPGCMSAATRHTSAEMVRSYVDGYERVLRRRLSPA